MLKNFRLIATVFVFAASGFGAFAQTNEADSYKDVLLNGKPAKLNLVTGEITYINGDIATTRAAKKIKDSLLATRTVIKTNLIKDMSNDFETAQNSVAVESKMMKFEDVKEITTVTETKKTELTQPLSESNNKETTLEETALVSTQNVKNLKTEVEAETSEFHVVKKGETLYALSKRYQTSLGQLMVANNLETTLIKVGETLRVRNFESSETISDTIWIVSKGDTLYNIAKRNNTTVDELKDLNELSGNLIKIGQKLQVNKNSILSKK